RNAVSAQASMDLPSNDVSVVITSAALDKGRPHSYLVVEASLTNVGAATPRVELMQATVNGTRARPRRGTHPQLPEAAVLPDEPFLARPRRGRGGQPGPPHQQATRHRPERERAHRRWRHGRQRVVHGDPGEEVACRMTHDAGRAAGAPAPFPSPGT